MKILEDAEGKTNTVTQCDTEKKTQTKPQKRRVGNREVFLLIYHQENLYRVNDGGGEPQPRRGIFNVTRAYSQFKRDEYVPSGGSASNWP